MKNIIEELKKYPDCEMMVVLHETLTAEMDKHISKMWSYCEFVEDADGTFVAPFPVGPEADEIIKVFPQLDDMVKEIEDDAEIIIEYLHRAEDLRNESDRIKSIFLKYEAKGELLDVQE